MIIMHWPPSEETVKCYDRAAAADEPYFPCLSASLQKQGLVLFLFLP
jgi:hypothetical protein